MFSTLFIIYLSVSVEEISKVNSFSTFSVVLFSQTYKMDTLQLDFE